MSPGRSGVALLAGLVLLAVLARLASHARRLDTVAVRGRSMLPALQPGDRLIIERLRGLPRRGDVVVARDPHDPRRELVKRVASVDDAVVSLVSDDPAGRDARVSLDAVAWRVTLRYWPLRRAGRLSRG